MGLLRTIKIGSLAFAAMICAGQSAFAARLMTATIELNGQVVLKSYLTDDGVQPREQVWRLLGQEPGTQTTATITADPADPLRATLRGDLMIRIRHVDRILVEAEATELTLVRIDTSSQKWFLPEREVERLAQANGIASLSSDAGNGLSPVAWAALGLPVVAFIAWRLTRTKPAGQNANP